MAMYLGCTLPGREEGEELGNEEETPLEKKINKN